jgi:predicted nucleotidyltransferase
VISLAVNQIDTNSKPFNVSSWLRPHLNFLMITREIIDRAVHILAETAKPSRIMVFGSYARGDAREDSDLDLLVIEPRVEDRAREMVRLRRALRPLRIPVEILVCSADEVARWGGQPGSALY